MNFKSKGVIISILILICLLLVCHISNFIYPKKSNYNSKHISKPNKNLNSFANLSLSIPKTPLNTEYNKITYDKSNDIYEQSLCNNINEAEIPCSIISACSASNTVPMTTPYELSESEWAVVYKNIYESAGLEVLSRELDEISPTPTTTKFIKKINKR